MFESGRIRFVRGRRFDHVFFVYTQQAVVQVGFFVVVVAYTEYRMDLLVFFELRIITCALDKMFVILFEVSCCFQRITTYMLYEIAKFLKVFVGSAIEPNRQTRVQLAKRYFTRQFTVKALFK